MPSAIAQTPLLYSSHQPELFFHRASFRSASPFTGLVGKFNGPHANLKLLCFAAALACMAAPLSVLAQAAAPAPAKAPASAATAQPSKDASPKPPAAEIPRLGTVVISGSRTERPSEDVPATLELMDAQQLERNQTSNIRELVKETPNVEVRRRSNRASINTPDGREGNAGFNIRGLDGNRVLILVDGQRAPRNYSFGASSRDNFAIGLIDRVEIVKGPSSALYGSDGIAGLVQFFTKSPETYLKGDKTWGGQASIAYGGDDESVTLGATIAGRASPALQWLLSANLTRAKELATKGDNNAPNLDRTVPNPQKDRETGLLGKIVLTPSSAQRHSFTLESVDKTADINLLSLVAKPPLAATSVLAANAQTDNVRHRLAWQGQFKLGAAWVDELKTGLSWQNFRSREYFTDDRNTAADRIRDTRDTERTLAALLQAEKTLAGSNHVHKLVYGLDVSTLEADHIQTGQTPPAGETFPLKRFPKTDERSAALFIQDEIVGETWSVVPALRWDRFSISADQAGFALPVAQLSDSAVSPKLGGTFKINPDWTLYGQWAAGFKAPTADQINRFFENATAFYKTIPNPNLRPEKSKSVELGVKVRTGDVDWDGAVFRNKYTDFINTNQVVGGTGAPGNPTVFQAVNVQSASIRGFEFKGNWRLSSRWSLPFAYGQTRGTNDVTGQPLNSVDPARTQLGLQYRAAWGDVRLDATHRAAKKVSDVDLTADGGLASTQFLPKSITTLDASAQWKIDSAKRLTLSVSNLTDKKYWRWGDVQNIAGSAAFLDAYSQPGRKLHVSFTADF
jgi:hemoglobin/transferrin/lactoferrin receptor protein